MCIGKEKKKRRAFKLETMKDVIYLKKAARPKNKDKSEKPEVRRKWSRLELLANVTLTLFVRVCGQWSGASLFGTGEEFCDKF